MTKEDCLSKIEELKKTALEIIDKRTKEIIDSGFTNLSESENNHILPKAILCASFAFAARCLKPLSKDGEETLKNINLI